VYKNCTILDIFNSFIHARARARAHTYENI